MNKKKSRPIGSLRNAGKLGLSALPLGLLLATAFGTQAQAMTLNVTSRAGAPITNYKYIINVDNTGTTEQRAPIGGCSPSDTSYPGTLNEGGPKPCNWVSIAGTASSSPIYTQGDQSDITGVTLPAGKYLISVLADGYKLDGVHVTGPATSVDVKLQPNDALPSATIQTAVFEDISPTNGAPDVPAERGLAGFEGHIADYIDTVTTDINGNPICSEYEADGVTPKPGTGGICLSRCYVVDNGVDHGYVPPVDAAGHCPIGFTPADDPLLSAAITVTSDGTSIASLTTPVIEGKLKIPNLGPNRYALSVTQPNGTNWQQTTTLEGNLDWDAWVMEGATGLDTEFVVAGEPFPAIIFGYVNKNAPTNLGGTGTVSGVVDAVKVYVPTTGGVSLPGTIWGGLAGGKIDHPIDKPWVTLTDLTNGDTAIWVGQGDANGHFQINGVKPGSYTLTWWDTNLNYILDLTQITVGEGENVDMGILPLTGWWTKLDGYVFDDVNENGIKDLGEAGLANYPVVLRKRENSLMDRGAVVATTDANGYYSLENGYPMTQWLVEEAYDDLHYTTGITYQADNQPTPTTVLGEGVDVSVLPIISLSGRLDWGKHSYKPGTNGGIVGTVSYGTTRNELDPRFLAVENWQPGVSNLPVHLYAPVPCGTTSATQPCDATGRYELETNGGAFKKGTELTQYGSPYITETWQRPSDCIARGVDGNPIVHGVGGEQVLPQGAGKECLEGPLMGVQYGPMAADGNFGAAVDGNYGFGGMPVGDYLVEVEVPNDATGKPLYKFTDEESINIANGDTFTTQVPPPECAGPLHTVDVATMGSDGYAIATVDDPSGNGGDPITVPASTPVDNATFVDIGGSPYEGQPKPSCGTKLVHVSNGKSIAPLFEVFTDVPVPGRFWGLVVDDLNFSSDPKSLTFGEKNGVPFAPVGIYDYTDTLVHTTESDYNGLFDVLLPSTNRISCPTPSGVCANLYRFVGNDPGIPGRLNPNYKPEFRTIAAEFEAFPGLIVPADLAPTQVGVVVQLPGGQVAQPLSCPLNVYSGPNITPPEKLVPELYTVNFPYVPHANSRAVIIQGNNFGPTRGTGNIYLDGIAIGAAATWSNTQITVTVPTTIVNGPHQLTIVASNGQKTVDGLTMHVLGTGYNPTVVEVGPGKTYAPAETLPAVANHAIQRAIDAAPVGALVVVYPNNPSVNNPRQNPRGAYYENLIITKPIKLQGVGPGGVRPDGSTVTGSIIDGSAFAGDSPVAADWDTRISLETAPDANGNAVPTWGGNATIYDGAVISLYVPATGNRAFTLTGINAPSIDGFDLRGGDQQGFPGNINATGGTPTGLPGGLTTQGGAIFANAYARNLQITNNVIQNNGGAYGTVRIGTPDVGDNQNDNIVIANNRIIANGGTNLAGGIGLFTGASNYVVANNDVCGNFSAEYGGGISAFGLNYEGNSAYNANTNFGGKIHHNRIYLNRSYDEGGGVMIAGQLPANPAALSPGAGPVQIYSNLIQANLSNDDGGGIRFLQASSDCNTTNAYTPCNIEVYNNMIVNNVSAHEGGGISLNDAPSVRVYNNTIMKNITTATAATSPGSAAPAGLSTSLNSDQLLAVVPTPAFSDPLLFNNIFWDNRAGTRAGNTVNGIGVVGDPSPINQWDLGSTDPGVTLSPTNSVIEQLTGYQASATNRNVDPLVAGAYDTQLDFAAWRTNPAFIGAIMVSLDVPPSLLGDYHLLSGSQAISNGAGSKATVTAPALDIDDGIRGTTIDIGADEQGVAGTGLGGGTGGGGSQTIPTLTALDTFTRANAANLGGNWRQFTLLGAASINVNNTQARASTAGNAYWTGGNNNNTFGASQAAAFTFTNATVNNNALILKASGNYSLLGVYQSYIRVLYNNGNVTVATTTNAGGNYATAGTISTAGNLANGNSLTAKVIMPVMFSFGRLLALRLPIWELQFCLTTLCGQRVPAK